MPDLPSRILPVAFYLPQFHPIPENDAWWGPGFTEWTNVRKAQPLFPGHEQPRHPAGLGYYDLREAAVRHAQAEMARSHGIAGFAYWHYWFAGRRVLERPFAEVLASGQPDFPFCLAWANQSWTGVWHGAHKRILIEQTYPGQADYRRHFDSLLPAFRDRRYLKINGRLLFIVFRPGELPDARQFIDCWRELARQEGLPGFYFVGLHFPDTGMPEDRGFDAYTVPNPDHIWRHPLWRRHSLRMQRLKRKIRMAFSSTPGEAFRPGVPAIYPYESALAKGCFTGKPGYHFHPTVFPNWDNTPRTQGRGVVFTGSTPQLFARQVRLALQSMPGDGGDRLLFIKSWNEWAEGNYLEPDGQWGMGYLEALRDALRAGVGLC